METIDVYSTVNDKNIRKNLNNSPIWNDAYTEDELVDIDKNKRIYKYTIKFDGLKPIQVTNISNV